MPIRRTVYDKGDAATEEPSRAIEMWDIDAREAVANGRGRYVLNKPAGFMPGVVPKAKKGGAEKDPAPVPDEVATTA